MKKLSCVFGFAFAILFLAACTQAPESDKAETTEAKEVTESTAGETWPVDPGASKLEFIATKVSNYHSGTVQIKNGGLQLKDGNILGGKFTMDMTTINVSGPEGSDPASNAKLTGHLKSPDFFEVAAYPEAVFEITAVTPFSGTLAAEQDDPRQASISKYKVQNPTHTVSGNLTIKNTTKNIQFPAKITVMDGSLEAIAKFNIDRTQWNIVYPGQPDDLIRNEIHFGIYVKAGKTAG